MRENEFLRWIAEQTPPHARVPLHVGDDMAVVRLDASSGQAADALLKIDQCLDQVHFDLRQHSAADAGRKSVNRCLSDCAAMACMPAAILISVALPREGPGSGEAFAKELFLACRDAAAVFDCPLVGGDTSIWDQRLAITVAAVGQNLIGVPAIGRAGARPGDTLFVSGALGGSILGRHLRFEPRIWLAQKVARAAGAGLHAMMDISDGLAQDLPRMCAASDVGATVLAARLPIHPDAHLVSARDHIPPGLHALADGEDYELLMAIDPEIVPEIVNLTEIPLTAIGVVTKEPVLLLHDADGRAHPWPRGGFEHHD